MTKKHFIALADDIKYQQEHGGWCFTPEQIEFIAHFCAAHNPNFNRERWLGYIAGTNGPNGGAR
jgi:hypothetical protein